MVGYAGIRHAADMRNSRSFAPLVADISSPPLHHPLRTGMRTAMVSSSFNAKHRECPSGNHKCTDIAKSSCCHRSILRKANKRVAAKHSANLDQSIRVISGIDLDRSEQFCRSTPDCRLKAASLLHFSQRILTTWRIWHPSVLKNPGPIHKR